MQIILQSFNATILNEQKLDLCNKPHEGGAHAPREIYENSNFHCTLQLFVSIFNAYD